MLSVQCVQSSGWCRDKTADHVEIVKDVTYAKLTILCHYFATFIKLGYSVQVPDNGNECDHNTTLSL